MKYKVCSKFCSYLVVIVFMFSVESSFASGLFDFSDVVSMFNTKKSYSQEAHRAFMQEDYPLAIKYCDKDIKANPSSGYSYGLRASCYSKLNKNELAFLDCNRAIQLSPQRSHSYALRARIYSSQGDYTNALSDCNKAIEVAPNDAYSYGLRGSCYSSLGNDELAFADCTKTIELAPRYFHAYSLRARIYSSRGDYTNALLDCSKVIEIAPDNAYSYGLQGWIYLKQNKNIKAITQLNMAIELDPNEVNNFLWRASAHLAEKDFDETIADIESARALGEENDYIYSMFARVAEQKGDYGKALEYLDKAISFAPKSPIILNAKAYIMCTSSEVKYRNGKEALRLAQMALKFSSGDNLYIKDTLACAYAELGQFEKAIEIQKKVVEMRPDQEVKDHLAAFEAGKPWREKVLSSTD